MFDGLDHVAIVVRDTEEALRFYRDRLGFPVVLSEVMDDSGVRLTHLDMGNAHLQLVEPPTDEHPLARYLDEHGEGLHHLCFRVGDVLKTMQALPGEGLPTRAGEPHKGPGGRLAAFLDSNATRGVLFEITGNPPES